MGTAREVKAKFPTQVLNVAYRKRQLEFRRKQISQWLENETDLLRMEVGEEGFDAKSTDEYLAERIASIEGEAKRQESEALSTFGMLQGADPSIAPLRRALAVWGLSIDDVGVASVSSPLFRSHNLMLTPSLAVPWYFDCSKRQERE